jgi:hypothetical protein
MDVSKNKFDLSHIYFLIERNVDLPSLKNIYCIFIYQ